MKKAFEPKDKFIARDLSWLKFNQRVLGEAKDKNNPLLERLKFLAIFMGNLDEFLMVRVAGLKTKKEQSSNIQDQLGFYPQEFLEEVSLG